MMKSMMRLYEHVAKASPDYERVPLDLPVVYVLKRKTTVGN